MTKLHEDLRTDLTIRFKEAIIHLMGDGVIQKSSQKVGLSYSDLSSILFGDRTNLSTFSSVVRGNRLADFPEAIILADTFDLSIMWMVTGEGEMITQDQEDLPSVEYTPGPDMISSDWTISRCFQQMRNDDSYHVSNGVIVLSETDQNGICTLVNRNYIKK